MKPYFIFTGKFELKKIQFTLLKYTLRIYTTQIHYQDFGSEIFWIKIGEKQSIKVEEYIVIIISNRYIIHLKYNTLCNQFKKILHGL